jgi:beta-phosphoglucomutase
MNLWPRAILFDFDGTLVNSEPLHFFAFAEVLRGEGIEVSESEYYRELVGMDDRRGFDYVFSKHGRPLDPKTRLRLMADKTQMMMRQIRGRKYQALPGVEEFVRSVWRHYPLAVCTGALREEVDVMLDGVNLRDCFCCVVAAEDVTAGKPDPEGYLLAMKLVAEKLRRRLQPGDCLVIEDAPVVVRSVRAAGFPVLAVATSRRADKLADANWVVPSLRSELVQRVLPGLKMYR